MEQFKALIIIALFATLIVSQAASQTQSTPVINYSAYTSNETRFFLHTDGDRIRNGSGTEIHLRGVNIGNWLLIEPWMISDNWNNTFGTEKNLWGTLNNSSDSKSKLKLIRTFRDNWFTESDVRKIAAIGLNCIRLPIWWRATNDSDYGGSFDYINQSINWCNNSSLYVILDLHGAPGGQNNIDKNLGEKRNENDDFWNNGDRQNQSIDWWEHVAKLYKNNTTVAGYDLLNEGTPQNFTKMIEFYDRTYHAIRTIDSYHIIIFEVGMDCKNLYRMPLPEDMGWTNIIYSIHYYPDCKNPHDAERIIFPLLQSAAHQYNVPIYVGEFNTIQMGQGCDSSLKPSERLSLFKLYRDIFEYYGWPWTFWTYKKIEENWNYTWGLYGHVDKAPEPDSNKTEAFIKMRTENTNNTSQQRNLTTELKKPFRWERPSKQFQDEINLTVWDAMLMRSRGGGLQVEWNDTSPNVGYWSENDKITWKFYALKGGTYEANLNMANNADRNIVQIWVDGVLATEVSIKNTKGGDRYENRSLGRYRFDKGAHTLAISKNDTKSSFLNVRYISLRYLGNTSANVTSFDGKVIDLNPANVERFQPKTQIHTNWFNEPPILGHWRSGGSVFWSLRLDKPGHYQVSMEYATPHSNTTHTNFSLLMDNAEKAHFNLSNTTGWDNYRTLYVGSIDIPEGKHNFSIVLRTNIEEDVANLRRVLFHKSILPT